MSNILSIVDDGEEETYDLEVDHSDHQFYLANGVLTSNSHAVAYAIDSFWCAWLLTYHEEQWLTAYMESMSNSPDKRAKAFGEIKSLGYQIVPIDINHATAGWTVLPGKKFMPSFLSCKGVGGSAIEEITDNRPYNTLEELLWTDDFEWKHSKFNKRALESLIKICAFNSLDIIGPDKIFSSYRHMHHVLIENMDLLKKSPKKDPHAGLKNLYEIARTTHGMPDWTQAERAQNAVDVFGSVDVLALVDPDVLQRLEEKGIRCIDQLEENDKELAWFTIQKSIPKESKNRKKYLLIEAVGLSGATVKLFCWGWDGTKQFAQHTLCLAEVEKTEFGCSTTVWKLKEIT